MKTTTAIAFFLALSVAPLFSQQCNPPTAARNIDINNIRALIHNGGDQFWNLAGRPHFEVPKWSGIHSAFMANLWIGGLDEDDSLKVAAGRYRTNGIDYSPGALNPDGTVNEDLCQKLDIIAEMNRWDVNMFLRGEDTTDNIWNWPASGNSKLSLPVQDLAPFKDVNEDGIYNPEDGDYPLIKGDGAIWYVMNDAANEHMHSSGEAVGAEIHMMTYGYLGSEHMNNTIFTEYKVHLKTQGFNEFYLGVVLDGDLGNPFDDFVGCDTTRDLGIYYNGDDFDQDNAGVLGYGTNPPQLGLRAVKLPKATKKGVEKGMSTFMYYDNNTSVNGDAQTLADHYNYMRGYWRDNTRMVKGGNGHENTNSPPYEPANYMYPSEPNDTTGWNECTAGNSPFDRRFLMSFGPFDFDRGEVIEATFAYVWQRDTSFVNSTCNATFDGMRIASDEVKQQNDSLTNCDSFNPNYTLIIHDENADNGEASIEVIPDNPMEIYSWSNGDTASFVDGLSNGKIYLTVNDGGYCYHTRRIDIGDVSSVENVKDENSFILHPNPASQHLRITFDKMQKAADVTVLNQTGQVMGTYRVTGSDYHDIDLSRYSAGFYFLQVQTEGHREIKKFVVAK